MPAKSNTKSAAEKLAERDADGTRTGANAPKPKADKPKAQRPAVSREMLEKAAKLRAEGATWNEIREATGTKLGSGAFQKHWAANGIDALPSHSDEFKRAKAEREGRAHKPDEKPAAPKTSGAAMKPDPERVARGKASVERARAARASKPARKGTARTSNGKAAPVRTRKATAAELAVAA